MFQNGEVFMASCVIFCAGGFRELWEPLEKDDYILCIFNECFIFAAKFEHNIKNSYVVHAELGYKSFIL
jgi:hypothetical protein